MTMKEFLLAMAFFSGTFASLHGVEDVVLVFDARTQYSGNTTSSLPINGSVVQGNPSLLTRISQPILCSGTALTVDRPAPVPGFMGSFVLPVSPSFTLGFSVNGFYSNNDTSPAARGTRVSVALAERISEQVSIGVTLYDDLAPSTPFTQGPLNVKAGLSVRPVPQACIALLVSDFLGSPNNKSGRIPASATLGLSYSVKEFIFGLDSRIIPEAGQVNFNAGGETSFFHRMLHVGIGFEYRKFIAPTLRQDARAASVLMASAGFGVLLNRFILDYSLSCDLGREALTPMHAVSFSMVF